MSRSSYAISACSFLWPENPHHAHRMQPSVPTFLHPCKQYYNNRKMFNKHHHNIIMNIMHKSVVMNGSLLTDIADYSATGCWLFVVSASVRLVVARFW